MVVDEEASPGICIPDSSRDDPRQFVAVVIAGLQAAITSARVPNERGGPCLIQLVDLTLYTGCLAAHTADFYDSSRAKNRGHMHFHGPVDAIAVRGRVCLSTSPVPEENQTWRHHADVRPERPLIFFSRTGSVAGSQTNVSLQPTA